MRLLAGMRFSHVALVLRNGRGYRLLRFLRGQTDTVGGRAESACEAVKPWFEADDLK